MSKDTPLRYGIYLAALDPTIGREIAKTRPVVVVSLDALNRHVETVVVCPLTTSLHPAWRTRLPVTCAGQSAEIAADQIRTLRTQRLVKKIDTLSPPEAARLRDLLGEMYATA
jgi:mRNA interferase MazF